MKTLYDWLTRSCACAHPDAHECVLIRMNRQHQRRDPGCHRPTERVDPDETCDCVCHDRDIDDESDDAV